MSEHVIGPRLASSPHDVAVESNKVPGASLGVAGRAHFFVTPTLCIYKGDKAGFVAADARKLVAAFGAIRAKLKQPELQAVLLLGPEQRLCAKVDNPARARPTLLAGAVAVYRLKKA